MAQHVAVCPCLRALTGQGAPPAERPARRPHWRCTPHQAHNHSGTAKLSTPALPPRSTPEGSKRVRRVASGHGHTWGKPRKKTPLVLHSTPAIPAVAATGWQVPHLVGASRRFCTYPRRTLTKAEPDPARRPRLGGRHEKKSAVCVCGLALLSALCCRLAVLCCVGLLQQAWTPPRRTLMKVDPDPATRLRLRGWMCSQQRLPPGVDWQVSGKGALPRLADMQSLVAMRCACALTPHADGRCLDPA